MFGTLPHSWKLKHTINKSHGKEEFTNETRGYFKWIITKTLMNVCGYVGNIGLGDSW